MCCFLIGAGLGGSCVCGLSGWFTLGVEAVSVVAEFSEAFELSIVRVNERGVHFLGFRWWACLCHWLVFLC